MIVIHHSKDWWIRLKRFRGVIHYENVPQRHIYSVPLQASVWPLTSFPPPIMSDSFTTVDTLLFIGTVIESSLYGTSHFEKELYPYSHISSVPGLYCVAFAVHARIRSKHKGGGINIAIYPLSVLFTLCTIYCAIDTAQTLFTVSIWSYFFLYCLFPIRSSKQTWALFSFFSYVLRDRMTLKLVLHRITWI